MMGDIMEIYLGEGERKTIYLLMIVPTVYLAAVYLLSKITVEKLNARSGLFGAGIVTMFAGFVLHHLMEYTAGLEYWYTGSDLSPLYFVLVYGFLIMGLSGILMIAMDLLKGINELKDRLSSVEEKASKVISNEKQAYGKIPAWKQIEEDRV